MTFAGGSLIVAMFSHSYENRCSLPLVWRHRLLQEAAAPHPFPFRFGRAGGLLSDSTGNCSRFRSIAPLAVFRPVGEHQPWHKTSHGENFLGERYSHHPTALGAWGHWRPFELLLLPPCRRWRGRWRSIVVWLWRSLCPFHLLRKIFIPFHFYTFTLFTPRRALAATPRGVKK
jgi:hypothetical protein